MDRARGLLAELAPTRIRMQLVRWLGPVKDGQARKVRVPFGDRACDLRTQFSDPIGTYSIAEHAVLIRPTPLSDFARYCTTGVPG